MNDFWNAPDGYEYWTEKFNSKLTRIWIRNLSYFTYCNGNPSSVWGFYNQKTNKYYRPINYKKAGEITHLSDTTPYSAMKLNLNPLELALYQ